MTGSFVQVGETTIYQGHVLHVVQGVFRSPTGVEFRRDAVRSQGAVAVVAVRDGDDGPEAAIVKQYRPVLDTWMTEIPAGMRDKLGEEPVATAARELAEEAGLAATHYELLTVFANAAGMTDQRTHVYLATGLTEVPTEADGVEEEYLERGWMPLRDVTNLVATGVLCDAKTILGLMLAREALSRR